MTDIRTISPDQLTVLSEIPEDLHAVVFSPAGPLQAVPYEKLLTKLIATDLAKTSRAALYADLAHPADSVALVFSDPVATQNGWYRKIGYSGAGSWEQFEELARSARREAAAAAAIAQAAAQVTLWAAGAPGFPDVESGLASVESGETFYVVVGAMGIIYRKDAGPTATEISRFIINPQASTSAALIGKAGGGTVQDALTSLAMAQAARPVTVKDFGAVGDDIANDTAAFAAAAATGRPVIVPDGTYRVNGCLFTARVTFLSGARIRRTGGSLAFAGGIDAPVEQIFLNAVGTSQVDVNNDLTPEGWVDWFGYDANAIETCHAIFHINRLGPRDYFADRTVILDRSHREVIGSGGSAEGQAAGGGTRIVLVGAAAASQPIVRVGTLNTSAVLSTARRLNIRKINTIRDGTINPATSGRREDAVPGWLVAGWYESVMEDCFDFGSPIHYRIYGTIGCKLNRCGGVRPGVGAANGFPDFYTAFCVGGYSTSFGFIGANASLTIANSGCAGGLGAERMGLYLFGFIGDTWVQKFEMSQLEYGIVIDGRDASGSVVTSLTAHQDVWVRDCILDALLFRGIWVRGMNRGAHIDLRGNYVALNAAGDGLLVQDCLGSVSVDGEDYIANSSLANFGVRIVTSKRVSVGAGVKIKDFRVGLRAESSGQLHLTPIIHRALTGGTNAVELSGVGRSYVQPTVDSDVAAFDYGIVMDSGTNFSEVNVSKVNFGCFTTVSAGRKIWHNGATWGGGGTFGTGNVATGVLA